MSDLFVDSTAALNAALVAAQGGDRILLAPGTYTGLDSSFNNLKFTQGITITSADSTREAVLTHFDIQNSSGITFAGVNLTTGPVGYFQFQVFDSNDIHFDYVSVHGSMDGNAQNDIEGIRFEDTTNVSITNSEFQQLERAMAIGSSTNVVVSGNTVHDVEVTGISLAQVANVQISHNSFSNFAPAAGDHPDAIQFLTSGTTASSHDISVTDNVISRGTGGATQGIFFRDQVGTLPYQNVTIANNLIDGTGYGGIAVGSTNGLTITGNVLVSRNGPQDSTPLQVSDSNGVVIAGNQATIYGNDDNTGVVLTDNLTIAPVADNGAAALHDWLAGHPNDAALITPLLASLPAVPELISPQLPGSPPVAPPPVAPPMILPITVVLDVSMFHLGWNFF